MGVYTWKTGVSGNWQDSAGWTTFTGTNPYPETGDVANITASGTYAVTIGPDKTDSVLDLTTAVGVTLAIEDNSWLSLDATGTITNNGTIMLNSAGDPTKLLIAGAVRLNGSGVLIMGDNANNLVDGTSYNDSLTNNSTIEGSGSFGSGGGAFFILDNAGTVDADQSVPLVLDLEYYDASTNTGKLEATNGGTLNLTNGTVNNTGGLIEAVGTGSVVLLTSGNNGAPVVTAGR
jgi:hypothetical protein